MTTAARAWRARRGATNHYAANSAWQQLSVLAHNLFRSMRTLRFLVIARAGRIVRIGGRTRLRLDQNPSVQQHYEGLEHALAAVR